MLKAGFCVQVENWRTTKIKGTSQWKGGGKEIHGGIDSCGYWWIGAVEQEEGWAHWGTKTPRGRGSWYQKRKWSSENVESWKRKGGELSILWGNA